MGFENRRNLESTGLESVWFYVPDDCVVSGRWWQSMREGTEKEEERTWGLVVTIPILHMR